jgi:hypothetical protein
MLRIHANFIAFLPRGDLELRNFPYASLRRSLDVHAFRDGSSAQPIEMRVHHGTRYPSVLSSFSYTADLCHSFIKELQGIDALY